MKSSSFLCGALFGMAAVIWASKRKKGLNGMLAEAGSFIKMPSSECNDHDQAGKSNRSTNGAAASAGVSPSPASRNSEGHKKDYNLKQLKELIKGSPEVRREVEAILKESHTSVPGI